MERTWLLARARPRDAAAAIVKPTSAHVGGAEGKSVAASMSISNGPARSERATVMTEHVKHYVCGVCATPSQQAGDCPACGADAMITVINGYLSAFPAQSVPCPCCGSTSKPLVFRGWVGLRSFLLWTSELRTGAYVCTDCALTESTKVLLLNALLGWWSLQAFFFYGWRGTYHNWRSVWSAPANPHEWGAINAHEFAAAVRADREDAFAAAAEEWLLTETPIGALSDTKAGLVLSAEELYELLGVSSDASIDELRHAFRQQAKDAHPDLREATSDATDQMVRLNRAWEILRDPEMRAAYDWLDEQRVAEHAA